MGIRVGCVFVYSAVLHQAGFTASLYIFLPVAVSGVSLTRVPVLDKGLGGREPTHCTMVVMSVRREFLKSWRAVEIKNAVNGYILAKA